VSPEDARRANTPLTTGAIERKADKLLQVRGLSTHFFTPDGVVQAVDDVSFEVDYGENLGLVGESGCGKSVTALSVARLVPNPPGRIIAGEILFDGINVLKLKDDDMRKLRGKEIGFIFQTPDQPQPDPDHRLPDRRDDPRAWACRKAALTVAELLAKVGIRDQRNGSTTTRSTSRAGCVSA
jgi:ABC-type glutathione transport system ATPase component